MSGDIHGGAQADATSPRCILPGCGAPTTEQGMPCDDCAASFGGYLRQTEGPAMTAEAQARRDSETHTAYAALLTGKDPAADAQLDAPAKPEREIRNARPTSGAGCASNGAPAPSRPTGGSATSAARSVRGANSATRPTGPPPPYPAQEWGGGGYCVENGPVSVAVGVVGTDLVGGRW